MRVSASPWVRPARLWPAMNTLSGTSPRPAPGSGVVFGGAVGEPGSVGGLFGPAGMPMAHAGTAMPRSTAMTAAATDVRSVLHQAVLLMLASRTCQWLEVYGSARGDRH